MAVQPLKPSQVEKKKHELIPDAVLEVFNELIGKNWDGNYSKFTLKEARALITKKLGKMPEIYMLDVESIYRKAGWKVTFDSPGWDESYDSFYEFKK